jgi:hypothetical protein
VENIFPVAAANPAYLWYAVPLVIVVSLVYSATRHEEMLAILQHAFRTGVWIAGFMGVIFAVLTLLSWWV